MEVQNLRSYLSWLITPATQLEQERFMDENLVDNYIALRIRIPTLTFQELVSEISDHLASLGKSTDLSPGKYN
jgi:hypothetical protein